MEKKTGLDENNNARARLNLQDTVFRASLHVFMALRGRKRHFPSGAFLHKEASSAKVQLCLGSCPWQFTLRAPK
ncbi:unnamed protein product [Pleuronectes platessa]|uniref:Uncharacterized protein n=1 Tax=Pleuronectes platessa TaxID=8262 RepID=A0A9N7W3Z5_PLEPL|nr:unnamed protein product [Pleuronectes platessa]